jgi:hypothetical protein
MIGADPVEGAEGDGAGDPRVGVDTEPRVEELECAARTRRLVMVLSTFHRAGR